MAYTVLTITPPTLEPVTATDLKAHLRLNTTAEDALLAGFISTARQVFENISGRTVLTTAFRQWVYALGEPIQLQRGPVQSVTAVKYYDPDGTLQTDSTYLSDLISTPGRVWWDGYPATSTTKTPVAYVEYSAGWPLVADVPAAVKTAVLLLASHFYENREAFTDADLKALPMGFRQVAAQFALGINGSWGV